MKYCRDSKKWQIRQFTLKHYEMKHKENENLLKNKMKRERKV